MKPSDRGDSGPAPERLVTAFMDMFQGLRHDNLKLLDTVYGEAILFQDPLHRIEGLEALKAYLARMYEGVDSIRFDYGEVFEKPGQAMLTWTMHLSHRRLRRGESLALPGASHIRFGNRVQYHRDYFDAGALLYERLPVLGGLVRAIRARI